jgi:PAS domain S-box-containing protein
LPDYEYLCVVEDISGRKEMEKALYDSERSMSVFINNLLGMAYRCNYDRDWTMQFVSAGCFDLTGYHSESLLHNRDLSFNDLIAPEYRETLWNEWARILALQIPFKSEYEIICADGEKKWVLEMGQGVFDEKGDVEALEGIIIDITENYICSWR